MMSARPRQVQGRREVLRPQPLDVLEACVAPWRFETFVWHPLRHRSAGIQAGMEGLEWLVPGP